MSSRTPLPNAPKSAEQSLQELVYAVSHDLGASARTIKGFADLLTRRYSESLDADGQNFLRLMSRGATDLQAQLDGLLAYSRVESRGEPLRPTDVAEVWQSVTAAAGAKIRDAAVCVANSPLPVVLADSKQLAALLSELLENAIKFRCEDPLRVSLSACESFPTGPVPVACWPSHYPNLSRVSRSATANEPPTRGRWGKDSQTLSAERIESDRADSQAMWLFRLADNGRGIATQHLARVFQMFQRCCPDVPGVGAGLAVAQRIVQRHGGTIWVESTIGEGTTICFTLPVV